MCKQITIGEQVVLMEERMVESGFTTFLDWDEGLTDDGVKQFCKKYDVEFSFIEVLQGVSIGVCNKVGSREVLTNKDWGVLVAK